MRAIYRKKIYMAPNLKSKKLMTLSLNYGLKRNANRMRLWATHQLTLTCQNKLQNPTDLISQMDRNQQNQPLSEREVIKALMFGISTMILLISHTFGAKSK